MQAYPFLSADLQQDLLAFAQKLVQTQSYSGQEEAIIRLIAQKMQDLGYENIRIDGMGNVLGQFGTGEKSILFDAHVDTVEVKDAEAWQVPPFSGAIIDGRLHGRGSVDMKSSVAASIYAGYLAHQQGFTHQKTVYVSCTTFEEDCDGENLKHLFQEFSLKPDFVVICEPSENKIVLGHKGKAQVTLQTHGISAHGSAPEKGLNAIYEMAEIIQRVEQKNTELMQKEGRHGSLVMSRISSLSASLNAVPFSCEVYLDRRTVVGETEAQIRAEMDALIAGKRASWALGTLYRTSWTGLPLVYEPLHEAWEISLDHPLSQACIAAYRQTFGTKEIPFDYWDFSTNAVTPVKLGIPTIGFGPGAYKLAHMRDESCEIHQIWEAAAFYTHLIQNV